MKFLPDTFNTAKFSHYLQQKFNLFEKFFENKSNRYKVGIVLDVICLTLLIINGIKPVVRIISPFITSMQIAATQFKMNYETFAFLPGSAPNKYDHVRFDHLGTLAFFDIPINENGSLYPGRGLTSLQSPSTEELFSRAKAHGTKVVITFSANDSKIIHNLLVEPSVQEVFITEAVNQIKSTSVDGLVLDLEFKGNVHQSYQQKLNTFVDNLTNTLHQKIPNSTVAIAIPGSINSPDSLYDLHHLSNSADKVFARADNFAVPESLSNAPKSPIYAYAPQDYWNDIEQTISYITKNVPTSKLVMETAWYGNGNNYPLYIPNSKSSISTPNKISTGIIDSVTIDRLLQGVPNSAKPAARQNIPFIIKALEDEKILDTNVLAYALATIEHETAGTFEPISEYSGEFSARRLGYEGGEAFHGRGFIQLTHLRNYSIIGERIGMGDQLVRNPELASSPEIAAKILAAYFKDNNVANLASQGFFEAARQPINPDRNGYKVAMLTWKYE